MIQEEEVTLTQFRAIFELLPIRHFRVIFQSLSLFWDLGSVADVPAHKTCVRVVGGILFLGCTGAV